MNENEDRKSGAAVHGRVPCVSWRRPLLAGFTLIELLAVVAIMAILLLVTIPSFDALKQRGMQTAVPQLITTLRLARQHAVTHRETVWVVFPDGTASAAQYNPPGEVSKALRAYAVISSNAASGRLEYITDWKFLPDGICFDNTPSEANSVFRHVEDGGASTRFPFPTDTDQTQRRNLAAVQFRPNGKAYRFDGSIWSSFAPNVKVLLSAAVIAVNTNSGSFLSCTNLPSSTNTTLCIQTKTGQVGLESNRQ